LVNTKGEWVSFAFNSLLTGSSRNTHGDTILDIICLKKDFHTSYSYVWRKKVKGTKDIKVLLNLMFYFLIFNVELLDKLL
jgi:hypothetical protein